MSLSFLVITGFIFLFFLFMFMKPDTSSYAVSNIVGGLGISEEFSVLTLVLAFVTLLVFLGILFFVYKKLVHKKSIKKEIPKPPTPKSGLLEGLEKGKDLFYGKNNEDILSDLAGGRGSIEEENELEEGEQIREYAAPKQKQIKKPVVEKKDIKSKEEEQKILTNLNQLKQSIISLLNQNYQRRDILKILETKGWSIEQIVKGIDDINLDNLKIYVKRALELGFNKLQIMDYLKKNNWEEEIILKAFPK